MSILSSIKSVAKKVVSTVKSALSNTNAAKQAAAVGSLFSKPVNNKGALDYTGSRKRVDQATGGYTGYGASGSWDAPKTSLPTIAPGPMTKNPAANMTRNPAGPSLPVTISSGKTSSPSSSNTLSSSVYTGGFADSTRTISAGSYGGASLAGSTTGGTQSINLASAPTAVNPGKANTTGLAGSLAGYYTRKDDGTFEPVTKDPFTEKTDDEIIKDKVRLYREAFGESTNVYDDQEVKRAQEAKRQAQQALQAPTAELNAVIAQQNQDLLSLRQTAQKEGVVEAVYGAQSNAINYNAAIRALPLQAHIASLRGNLELATDYLNELVTVKKEQIKTQYDYNKGLFDTIYSALDAKEKRVADRLVKENDRQYKAEDELIDYKAELVQKTLAVGASSVTINAIERAKDKISAASAAGNLTPPPKQAQEENKPLNNTQAVATGFAQRMIEADDIINKLGSKFVGISSYAGALAPNPLKSPERQKFEQAQRNFINAVLRKESGAVISEEEFANARQQYFPQPGDSNGVLEQKRQNRLTSINGLLLQAGSDGVQSSAAPRSNVIVAPDGQEVILVD